MTRRNIGKEIIDGLSEIRRWRQGRQSLKTTEIKLPVAADVIKIRQKK